MNLRMRFRHALLDVRFACWLIAYRLRGGMRQSLRSRLPIFERLLVLSTLTFVAWWVAGIWMAIAAATLGAIALGAGCAAKVRHRRAAQDASAQACFGDEGGHEP